MKKHALQAAFRAKQDTRAVKNLGNFGQARIILPDRIEYCRKSAFAAWIAHWYEKLMTPEDYVTAQQGPTRQREMQEKYKINVEICVNNNAKLPLLTMDGVTVARFIYDYKFNEADAESFDDERTPMPVQEKKP